VTIYEEALDFLMTDGADLSPESPCFAIFAEEKKGLERGGKKVIQYPLEYDLLGTLEIALTLFPSTRNLMLVTGTGKSDQAFVNRAQRDLESWKGKLNIDFTGNRPLDSVVQQSSDLPDDTIVICSRVTSDVTEKAYVPRDVARRIASVSNAPVFCMVSAQLDTGTIGGSMIDFESVGAMLGRSVVNIVNGKPLDIGAISQYRPMFNWEQVLRWGIDPKLIPKDSMIINRPETLWGQYKKTVLITITVFIVLMMFIFILIIQNRRRMAAEKSARLSQAHFSLLIDKAPDAIVVYDAQSKRFVEANVSAEKLFGLKRADLLQFGPDRFFPKNQPDYQRASEQFQRLVKKTREGEEPQFELTVHTIDGREVLCEVRFVQLPSENDGLIRASFLDITERKKTEKDLLHEKDRYRTILQTAMDGFWVVDNSGRFKVVNDAYSQMIGYSIDELMTMEISDVEALETTEEIGAHIKAIMKEGRVRFESRHRRKDGTIIDVEVSVQYDPGDGGHCICFISDITDRKQYEKELVRKTERYQSILKTAIDGYLLADMTGRILDRKSVV
jgi:PAS domain S-box-containing protein